MADHQTNSEIFGSNKVAGDIFTYDRGTLMRWKLTASWALQRQNQILNPQLLLTLLLIPTSSYGNVFHVLHKKHG